MLTPIAKSWPSEWCLEANSLAIQVHGGYGYTRDFPVEQYWRDNRLNMIHEGTHGIQALDLLGRKVVMEERRAGWRCWPAASTTTIDARRGGRRRWPSMREALAAALQQRRRGDPGRLGHRRPEEALANATPYLQAFGHVVLAWIWLDVALHALRARLPRRQRCQRGKLAGAAATSSATSCRGSAPGSASSRRRDDTCRTMAEEWF